MTARAFRDPAYPRWVANVLMLVVVALALVVSFRDQGAAERADHRVADVQVQTSCRARINADAAAAASLAGNAGREAIAAIGHLVKLLAEVPRDQAAVTAGIDAIDTTAKAVDDANASAAAAADRLAHINDLCPDGGP